MKTVEMLQNITGILNSTAIIILAIAMIRLNRRLK
jgi:hypothetical protein